MKAILLVEDDDDLRELTAHTLERAGCEVRQARNGEEALRELDNEQSLPALVLLDLMMPVMTGQQFLQVRAGAGKVFPPVVVVSAVADLQRPPGAAAYLQKPVAPPELLRIVRDHVH